MATLLKLFLVVALLFTIPGLFALFFSGTFLYHPTELSPANAEGLARRSGYTYERLEVAQGIELSGLVHTATTTGAPWIMFFGGNAFDLGTSHWILSDLLAGVDANKAVFAYRGYDGSTGTPTKAALLSDAEAAFAHLRAQGADPKRLILIGQSLGTGVASHLAATLSRAGTPPAGLVLLSAYTSMARVFQDHFRVAPIQWGVREDFRNDRPAEDIRCPVVLIHGDADQIIAVDHALALKRAFGDRATLHVLANRTHNDLWDDPRTVASIEELAATLSAD